MFDVGSLARSINCIEEDLEIQNCKCWKLKVKPSGLLHTEAELCWAGWARQLGIVGGIPAHGWGLELGGPRGLFQPKPFCDSIILWSQNTWQVNTCAPLLEIIILCTWNTYYASYSKVSIWVASIQWGTITTSGIILLDWRWESAPDVVILACECRCLPENKIKSCQYT